MRSWWMWRPFRRPNRNLGTLGGNPSILDEVNAEGPPVVNGTPAIGYWAEERQAAAEADLSRDVATDFESETDDENAAWDHLADEVARSHDNHPSAAQEPDDSDLA